MGATQRFIYMQVPPRDLPDVRKRKRQEVEARPSPNSEQSIKKPHATSGKRDKERQDFENRSLHPNPRKFSIRKVKKHFGSNLVPDEMNRSAYTPVGCRARAFNVVYQCCYHWADSPHHSADGTHGDPAESSGDEQRTARNTVASPNVSDRSEHQGQPADLDQSVQPGRKSILDGVTPPPTDNSGRSGKGCNPKQTLSPTERRTNKLWHRKREVENPNRKRSPEQEADKTRSS
ncbi:hypothetical protein J6590_073949 [Homalodisca vitripennis]|nr:hypothetical protein J6590_073949 [Homalodisca vitripennis]